MFEPASPRFILEDHELRFAQRRFGKRPQTVAVYKDLPEVPEPEWSAYQFEHGTLDSFQYRVVRLPAGTSLATAIAMCEKSILEGGKWLQALVLDTHHPTLGGGTGQTSDWNFASELVQSLPCPVVLAGGLTPQNVGEAIGRVMPWGVDVSSGVERSPGIKDGYLVKRFCEAARIAFEKIKS